MTKRLAPDALLETRFTLPDELIRGVQLEKEIVETTARSIRTRKVMVPPEPFGEIVLQGRVVALFDRTRVAFVHGVRFENLSDRDAAELERFIHLWQVRQLRARASQRGL